MEREYGIGRLVLDTDPVEEMLAQIEAERLQPRPRGDMVKCSCGHTVSRINVMNANLGTSCPDCYDRLSDF